MYIYIVFLVLYRALYVKDFVFSINTCFGSLQQFRRMSIQLYICNNKQAMQDGAGLAF